MVDDLILTSFKAQCKYVSARIHNKKDLYSFLLGVNNILDIQQIEGIKINSNSKYYTMVQDIWDETAKNLTERFVDGRSGDAYLEKI
jgi:hypothetical protein